MNDMARNLILWIIIAVVLMSVFNSFSPRAAGPSNLSYSEFLEHVRTGQVKDAVIQEEPNGSRTISGELTDGRPYSTFAPRDEDLINDLLSQGVAVRSERPEKPSLLL